MTHAVITPEQIAAIEAYLPNSLGAGISLLNTYRLGHPNDHEVATSVNRIVSLIRRNRGVPPPSRYSLREITPKSADDPLIMGALLYGAITKAIMEKHITKELAEVLITAITAALRHVSRDAQRNYQKGRKPFSGNKTYLLLKKKEKPEEVGQT